jgi:hypothetical protein
MLQAFWRPGSRPIARQLAEMSETSIGAPSASASASACMLAATRVSWRAQTAAAKAVVTTRSRCPHSGQWRSTITPSWQPSACRGEIKRLLQRGQRTSGLTGRTLKAPAPPGRDVQVSPSQTSRPESLSRKRNWRRRTLGWRSPARRLGSARRSLAHSPQGPRPCVLSSGAAAPDTSEPLSRLLAGLAGSSRWPSSTAWATWTSF